MPGYKLKKWNESNTPMDFKYIRESHEKGLWSLLSNFVRLYALYNEGGIYLDTDVEIVKNFNSLLSVNCFVGFQQEKKESIWINNAVIGSTSGHPFLEKCMELTLERLNKRRHYNRGPVIFTKILTEMGLKKYGLQKVGDVKVFPVEYFYPYPWWAKFSSKCITEHTFCIHHWQMSWIRREDGKFNLTWWLGKKYRRILKSYFGI